MSARIDTAEALTKSEKLARTMDNVLSGGRAFNRQLAAQVRDALRSQQREIDRLTAALAEADRRTRFWIKASDMAQDRGAAQMQERAARSLEAWCDIYGRNAAETVRALPLRGDGDAFEEEK